jgi:hypothetical protein
MPYASTDTARIGYLVYGAANRFRWTFSDYFTIRPDPRVGDAPPVVRLLRPRQGDHFEAGQPVRIAWFAADDNGLRSFDVQASYDSGHTWNVIARDLPADARSFVWRSAPNTSLFQVRVRVIARDTHFQNSSDGTRRSFSVGALPADTVAIQQAVYSRAGRSVTVQATSTDPAATLTVYDASDSTFLGTLADDGAGNYTGTLPWPVNPQLIEVRSSLGGAAMRPVPAQ